MNVKRESEVAQLGPTLSDPMDCSLPGSSVHEIFQAKVLEWGAIAFSATFHVYVLIYYFCLSDLLHSIEQTLGSFIRTDSNAFLFITE